MAKRRSLLIPLVLAVILACGYGVYWMLYLRGSVFTDDARVEGDVIPCATRIMGRLIELPFTSGMRVKKNDVIYCNFANVDVIGHIENETAVIEAVEAVDNHLGGVIETAGQEGLHIYYR